MSLSRIPKPSTGQLPKSVKVRSTCNACQQAKIRCSHEKPSCRRCQKHRIDCVYSMSRRLGRPAKKTEAQKGPDRQNSSPGLHTDDPNGRVRRARMVPKQKCQSVKLETGTQPSCRGCGDGSGSFQNPNDQEFQAEDPVLQIDFTSETWLQELTSGDFKDSMIDTILDSSHDNTNLDNSLGMLCEGLRYPTMSLGLPATDSIFCPATTASDSRTGGTGLERGQWTSYECSHTEAGGLSKLEVGDSGPMADAAWDGLKPEPQPWIAPSITASTYRSNGHFSSLGSPEISHCGGSFSSDELDLDALPGMTGCRCGCYIQVMRELDQAELPASRKSSSRISSILANQKLLLEQAETVLRCELCPPSEARANLLMVIIVRIDSLLTTLEATVTSDLHDGLLVAKIPSGCKKQRDRNGDFLSHINACPLLVGNFRVPNEEKTWFIRQMLQVRLSMLLLTIRRIRHCTQQLFAVTPSRGRLMMIMETDRRVQLIIMKIRMITG